MLIEKLGIIHLFSRFFCLLCAIRVLCVIAIRHFKVTSAQVSGFGDVRTLRTKTVTSIPIESHRPAIKAWLMANQSVKFQNYLKRFPARCAEGSDRQMVSGSLLLESVEEGLLITIRYPSLSLCVGEGLASDLALTFDFTDTPLLTVNLIPK